MSKLYLELRLFDEYGRTHGVIKDEVPDDCAYMGRRIVDELRLGVVNMNGAVRVMRIREVRREVLAKEAQRFGYRLADFLQDREGWHGADRSEAVEKLVKQGGGVEA